ncbi:MAG: hypothetical protein R3Y11_09255 [Pseudomonadota bacterium]
MAVELVHGAGRTTTVYYDDEACTYIKCFTRPKWYTKKAIKIALGLYRTPGKHVEYISHKLQANGLLCPELVQVEDYRVVSKDLQDMPSLGEYRTLHGDDAFRAEQIDVFARMLNAHILHKDPHDGNFLCNGKDIFVIDVDALSDSRLKFLPRQLMLYRLWRSSKKNYDFIYQIALRWPKRTVWEQCMDCIYTIRTYAQYAFKEDKKGIYAFLKHINAYLKEHAL